MKDKREQRGNDANQPPPADQSAARLQVTAATEQLRSESGLPFLISSFIYLTVLVTNI